MRTSFASQVLGKGPSAISRRTARIPILFVLRKAVKAESRLARIIQSMRKD